MTLHRWTDASGVEWACIAYDHGPLCRNCEQVTDVGHFLLDEHDKGFVDISAGPNGKMVFGLTAAGRVHAQEIKRSSLPIQHCKPRSTRAFSGPWRSISATTTRLAESQ